MREDVRLAAFWALLALSAALMGFFARGILDTASGGHADAAAASRLEMHYAPGEDLEAIDVALIGDASESIDIAAYVLTDAPVVQALTDAAERGVRIRLYRMCPEYAAPPAVERAIDALAALPSVTQRFKRAPELMHLKSYCVDGRLLRGGAANFSASGLRRQDNDLTILREPGACDRFEKAFEAMWAR